MPSKKQRAKAAKQARANKPPETRQPQLTGSTTQTAVQAYRAQVRSTRRRVKSARRDPALSEEDKLTYTEALLLSEMRLTDADKLMLSGTLLTNKTDPRTNKTATYRDTREKLHEKLATRKGLVNRQAEESRI